MPWRCVAFCDSLKKFSASGTNALKLTLLAFLSQESSESILKPNSRDLEALGKYTKTKLLQINEFALLTEFLIRSH